MSSSRGRLERLGSTQWTFGYHSYTATDTRQTRYFFHPRHLRITILGTTMMACQQQVMRLVVASLFILLVRYRADAFYSARVQPKEQLALPHKKYRQPFSSTTFRWAFSKETSSAATNEGKTLDSSSLRGLADCRSATQARRFLESRLKDRPNRLYASLAIPPGASSRGISDGDLAIQTRMVNKRYSIMEVIDLAGDKDADRATLAVGSVFVGSTLSALVTNQNLPGPEILRFIVVWIFSFAPLALIGYGIADVDRLQTVLVGIQRQFFPVYRRRMIEHEAGHFLMAHLLGWPVSGYTANAVKNAVQFYPLSDSDKGRDYASLLGFDRPRNGEPEESPRTAADVPFFSKEGSGGLLLEERSVFREKKNYTAFLKLPQTDEPTKSWPYRGFSDAELDQLTMVSVAGVCAEIIAFGNAEGGVADFGQLRQIFASADEDLTQRDIEKRIRFALGFTMSSLRRHLGALDALTAVMERDGSVEECVLAIETCLNPSGQLGFGEDYEVRRRRSIQTEKSWIERVLLGTDRTIDVDDDRFVEGKGGGSRKEQFQLSGDDPLYAALGVALLFLAWASSGGLSLH